MALASHICLPDSELNTHGTFLGPYGNKMNVGQFHMYGTYVCSTYH